MMSSLYSGATGMKVHGEGLNIVSSNLANVSTVGYKQKSMLFQDLISAYTPQGSNTTSVNQVGLGAQLGGVRTLFTDGTYEPSNNFCDLSIGGKGFFQVTKDDKTHYTRAGNFKFTKTGELIDPNGFNLTGIPIKDGKEVGGLTGVKIDFNDSNVSQNPPKASTRLDLQLNLGINKDKTVDPENPFFSLHKSWNSKNNPPLSANATGYTQAVPYYDADGVKQNASIRFDLAKEENGRKTIEYVISQDPSLDKRANFDGSKSQGLLMMGTLTFSSDGKLVDTTAFTAADGDPNDLASWKPAILKNGNPVFTVEHEGLEPQDIEFSFGVSSKTNTWQNAPASAADVGKNPTMLPKLGSAIPNVNNSTAYGTNSSQNFYTQDGYGKGDLTDMFVSDDGTVRANYSNGVSLDIFRVPVFRFTSEDGLSNVGMNHFQQTNDAGEMEYGKAGTENYGKIKGFSLEGSNVEMSVEMVNLIITQRGFQTNSKTISTADQMLQKAMELKRN